jgi:protein disulfide-isomerase A1
MYSCLVSFICVVVNYLVIILFYINMNTKLILLFVVLGLSVSQNIPTEEGVLILSESNFDQALSSNEFILVEFYAPWCGHCKKLAPEYAKAAQTLASDNPLLKLAKVDGTLNKSIIQRIKIEAYPTLKLFINGEPSDYSGGRTSNDIVTFMKKRTGPATKLLNSVEEVEKFKESYDISVVYFGKNNEIINKIARSSETYPYGQCNTQACFDNYKTTEGRLVLFKKFDEGRNDYTGEFTEASIKSFVEINSKPHAMKFEDKAAQLIFANKTPALILYRKENAENTPELDRILKTVAAQFKGKLQVVTTDIKQGLEVRLADYIGITDTDLPTVRLSDTRTDLKNYKFVGEINEANLLRFVADWEEGKLKQYYRSQEIPEKQTEPVMTLVAKNFDEIVMDPTKDVLVEFYAPWCNHCKKLTPIYEQLAKNLSHNPNLIIAKMDATANEIENLLIEGFPTIKFWPANFKNNPIDFNEERNIESFTKFLEVHGATSIKEKHDL